MNKRDLISAHHAAIGRRGGLKTSPAKRAAARAAALCRWGRKAEICLPAEELSDGTWYRGEGRNADMGLWDARGGCFWVVSTSDQLDPARFPEPGPRKVRLKRERHVQAGGTFRPCKEVG